MIPGQYIEWRRMELVDYMNFFEHDHRLAELSVIDNEEFSRRLAFRGHRFNWTAGKLYVMVPLTQDNYRFYWSEVWRRCFLAQIKDGRVSPFWSLPALGSSLGLFTLASILRLRRVGIARPSEAKDGCEGEEREVFVIRVRTGSAASCRTTLSRPSW